MRSSARRVLALVIGTPVVVALIAASYMLLMTHVEGQPRDFGESLQWAAETLTTTGYGTDGRWVNPVMIGFVVFTQFAGVALTFIVFSLILVPYFERRFEGRLPQRPPPKLRDFVLIYRWGPAVSSLLDELERSDVRVVVLEEDEPVARRLIDRGRTVVMGDLEAEDPDPAVFAGARAIVANGTDQQNAALILSARQLGFEHEIIALADRPLHRKPMMLAGANSVYTPLHILAAAMASLASERISPRFSGLGKIGGQLHTAELRISADSDMAGDTLAGCNIRARTGATIIGQWSGGEFEPQPSPHATLAPGAILLAVGSEHALEELGRIATPLQPDGPLVVCGYGEVGFKVTEFLRDAGEKVVVIDRNPAKRAPDDEPGTGADVTGDALDQQVLKKAGVENARGVVLCLGDDSTTLFAASVVRDFARDVPVIARVNRADHVERIHRLGADFALSLSEVAGEMLAQKMLGADWISLEARLRLERVGPAGLVGQSPAQARVGQQTGVSVVAVERAGEVSVEFDGEFRIQKEDTIYICGLEQGIARYHAAFPGARLEG